MGCIPPIPDDHARRDSKVRRATLKKHDGKVEIGHFVPIDVCIKVTWHQYTYLRCSKSFPERQVTSTLQTKRPGFCSRPDCSWSKVCGLQIFDRRFTRQHKRNKSPECMSHRVRVTESLCGFSLLDCRSLAWFPVPVGMKRCLQTVVG